MSTPRVCAVLLGLGTALPGCATTLGGVGTYAPAKPVSGHLGLDLEGHVPVSSGSHFVVGGYAAHVFQVHPGTASDQGRLAAVVGYSGAAASDEQRLGFEGTLRLGGFRGSNGPLVKLGALGIATVSPVVRLSTAHTTGSVRSLSDVTWALVPQLTAGVLLPFDDVKVEPELGAGIALRAYLCASCWSAP